MSKTDGGHTWMACPVTAVILALQPAINQAINNAVGPALAQALSGALNNSVNNTVNGAMAPALQNAVAPAVQNAVGPAVAAALNTVDSNPGLRDEEQNDDVGEPATGPADDAEKARSEARRYEIVEAVWERYQALLQERGEDYLED
ncbi:hypothetical protein B0H14DRAFT_2620845 [Mycena olivaceomarginata]|nr:hypothetical protein B0H14DRAFT_2620845 [Mycena olivaceomarginata]